MRDFTYILTCQRNSFASMPFSANIQLSDDELKKLKDFECLREKMFELSEETLRAQLHKLSVLRLSSSQTNGTQSPEALERWNNTQMFIHSTSSSLLDYDFIKKINGLLTGNETPERSQDIFAGGASFLSNQEKDIELEYFKSKILPELIDHHPIVASTAIRYWIVSLHPFKDGNGRTSQSLGDALLLKNQFPPLFFKNPHQGSFAYIPKHRENFTFNDALQSSFVGLNNAFNLILENHQATHL